MIGKELTDEQWYIWEQFIKFTLVGCSNSLICLLVCYLIIWLGGEKCYLFGQTVGYIVAVANSFFWNSRYVFKDYCGDKRVAFIKMCFCNGIIYMLQMTVSFLSVNQFGISEWIAPVIAIFFALPVNFLLNKLVAFK